MPSELVVTLLRLGYLVLLWVLVIAAINVLRRDIFGTVVTSRGRGRTNRKTKQPKAATPAPPARKAETPRTGPPTRLILTGGPLTGSALPLGSSPILIGRAPSSTLVLDDDYASGRHARLYPQGDTWWLEDLGSTNGTYVDDERVVQPRPLQPGIRVRIGQTTMELAR